MESIDWLMKLPEATLETNAVNTMSQVATTDLITKWMRMEMMSNSNSMLTVNGDEVIDWMSMTMEEINKVLNPEILPPIQNMHQPSSGKNLLEAVTNLDHIGMEVTAMTAPMKISDISVKSKMTEGPLNMSYVKDTPGFAWEQQRRMNDPQETSDTLTMIMKKKWCIQKDAKLPMITCYMNRIKIEGEKEKVPGSRPKSMDQVRENQQKKKLLVGEGWREMWEEVKKEMELELKGEKGLSKEMYYIIGCVLENYKKGKKELSQH
ncbi:6649_t:CDS:2 [Paraglomus occultum]|uniref:6649_t:CDS:1 n=1 Tax=Paraglomus occultum TaxID=144539 RepID=A0A9N9G1A3_9GLOM|nr:6649_t:CDS:2 [Paraglomus occultum]